MFKKTIASILTVLILINSIGCYTYSQIKKEDTIKLESNDKVKITTLDGKEYYLTNVEIEESILRGYTYGYEYRYHSYRKEKDVTAVTIPTEEIKEIEIDKINPYLTALVAITGVIGVFMILMIAHPISIDLRGF